MNGRLTDRDIGILEHVARYGVTTDAVLKRVFFPRSASIDAVQKRRGALVSAGLLRRIGVGGEDEILSTDGEVPTRIGSAAS